jgi:hypothetical protein
MGWLMSESKGKSFAAFCAFSAVAKASVFALLRRDKLARQVAAKKNQR